MPVTLDQTREELRVKVGRLLGGVRLVTAQSNGSTTTFVTDDLFGSANSHKSKWWLGTDTPNDGIQARVTASSVASDTTTLTLFPAVSSTVNADTAELWETWLNPEDVHNALDQAVYDATGYVYNHVEDVTLHGGDSLRFDIPTTIEAIFDVYTRDLTRSRQVIPAGVVWNESIDADFTVTEDTEDALFGRTTTRFVIGGSVSAGDLASHAIASVDLSGYDFIEFPIKVRLAVAANDLNLRLSATINGADTDKIIPIPAIAVGVDTWVRVGMTELLTGATAGTNGFDASEATAIISVALEYNANEKANTIWLGEIRATLNDEDDWVVVPRHLWRIEKEARDLLFEASPGYQLIKMKAGAIPTLLTSDSTVTQVPEDFIVYRAAAHLLEAQGGGSSTDPENRVSRARRFFQLAEQARGKFSILANLRTVT